MFGQKFDCVSDFLAMFQEVNEVLSFGTELGCKLGWFRKILETDFVTIMVVVKIPKGWIWVQKIMNVIVVFKDTITSMFY